VKKLIFILLTLCMAETVFAQTTFGIKAGPDFSSVTTKTSGNKSTSNGLIGVEAGVYGDFPVAQELYIRPSLMYAGKGGRYNLGEGYVQTQRLNYITLPVDVLYKAEIPGGSGAWFAGAGPYAAYGISGKTSDNSPGSVSYDPFKSYSGSSFLNRFDAGAHVQVGYEMAGGFNVGINAALGLMNIATQGNSKRGARNTTFGLTLGYTWKR
jgi:hypothetical protein